MSALKKKEQLQKQSFYATKAISLTANKGTIVFFVLFCCLIGKQHCLNYRHFTMVNVYQPST